VADLLGAHGEQGADVRQLASLLRTELSVEEIRKLNALLAT
jgi:hypothetical protein